MGQLSRWRHGRSLTASPPVGSWRYQQEEARLNVPLVPGAQWQNGGPHEEVAASHVARSYPPHPVLGDGTITIKGTLKDIHGSSDVLPERVRPKGEPTEEPESRRH